MFDVVYHLSQVAGFGICTGLLWQVWRANNQEDLV
jgi:hypothetical protein